MKQRTVLVLDDSEICIELVRYALEEAGFGVEGTTSALGFTKLVNQVRPDVALVDVSMPALSGDKLVEILLRSGRHTCAILLHSDRPAEELRRLAHVCGATGYVQKAPECAGLVTAVRRALPR